MLTFEKLKTSAALEATITPSPETSAQDLSRLDRLAHAMYAHKAAKPTLHYILTEARGRKCWLLWQNGFDAVNHRGKDQRFCITHPNMDWAMQIDGRAVAVEKINRVMLIADAVKYAEAMERCKTEMVEAVG